MYHALVKTYGYDRVRGGVFSKDEPCSVLKYYFETVSRQDLCLKCGGDNYYYKVCDGPHPNVRNHKKME